MTVVIDPSGTPVPVYTRSGTVMVPIAAVGETQMSAAQIPDMSGHVIALVTTDTFPTTEKAVKLPPDADIGTLVEVYHVDGNTGPAVFPPDSQTIGEATDSIVIPGKKYGASFRKLSATNWAAILSVGDA